MKGSSGLPGGPGMGAGKEGPKDRRKEPGLVVLKRSGVGSNSGEERVFRRKKAKEGFLG